MSDLSWAEIFGADFKQDDREFAPVTTRRKSKPQMPDEIVLTRQNLFQIMGELLRLEKEKVALARRAAFFEGMVTGRQLPAELFNGSRFLGRVEK